MTVAERLTRIADAYRRSGQPIPLDLAARLAVEGIEVSTFD